MTEQHDRRRADIRWKHLAVFILLVALLVPVFLATGERARRERETLKLAAVAAQIVQQIQRKCP